MAYSSPLERYVAALRAEMQGRADALQNKSFDNLAEVTALQGEIRGLQKAMNLLSVLQNDQDED